MSEAARWWNTGRPLTHSLDFTEEGLAMQATQTCSIPYCARPRKSRGWCNTHYERWRLTGSTDDPVAAEPFCQIAGCSRPTKGRGWCKYHWQRWSRHGDPNGGATHRARASGMCAVETCGRPDRSRGWCKAHYYRWRQYGDPTAGSPPALQTPRPDDWTPTYSAAHWRVHRANGPAAEYTCIDCGERAEHWSYDHADPCALTAPGIGLAYSLDIEHYDPRCVSCHRKFDLT